MRTQTWRAAKGGTVALEFGMIGLACVGLLLLVFQMGFVFFAQTSLDFAARQAARQMQTGQSSPADAVTFKSLLFCPYLSPFLSCAGVTITLQPVTDFTSAMTNPPASPYDSGSAGTLMLLQATYTTNLPHWPLNASTIVGTSAYRNE